MALNLDKIRHLHQDWVTGHFVCPQPDGPCIRCHQRAELVADRVPALLAEVERLRTVVDPAIAWRAQFGEFGPLDSADTPAGDLSNAVDALRENAETTA